VLAVAACSGGDDGDEAAPTTSTTAITTTTAGPAGAFTSLSYNVAGLPQGVNPDQSPELHQPLISPLLDAYDVVLVQEDFGTYTDVLRAEATHEHRSEPHPGPATMNPIGREGAAVGDGLNILSRLPIGPLERVPWTGCGAASGDCLALKGFAATDLTLAPGVSIGLYTLHVEAGRDDAALRGDDLDELAAHLEARGPGAVIIGGDWNLEYADDPDGDQLRGFLAGTGLQDVCDVVDCGADADVIDRFLFRSGDGVVLTPTRHRFERETFVDPAGAPLSDHDPLAVDWSWST
jgi:hypothetical protein